MDGKPHQIPKPAGSARPKKRVIPFAYTLVDACLSSFLEVIEPVTIRRQQLIYGTVTYQVYSNNTAFDEDPFGAIHVLPFGDKQTALWVSLAGTIGDKIPNDAESLLDDIADIMDYGIEAVYTVAHAFDDSIKQEPRYHAQANPNSTNTSSEGILKQFSTNYDRRIHTINEWVREQLAQGRSREDIEGEYLQRDAIDPSDSTATALAKDRLRQIIKRYQRSRRT